MAQLVGVVLAGGRGDRFGTSKAELRLGNATLAERAARLLWPLCGSVLVSVRPGVPTPAPGYPTLPDAAPAGRGPLAGIDAAFAATTGADLLVLACDYPFIEAALLGRLVECAGADDQVVLPTDFVGRDHPLVALWRRSAAPRVRDALAEGRFKVRSLLADLAVRRVGPPELAGIDLDRVLRNVNRPEDLVP